MSPIVSTPARSSRPVFRALAVAALWWAFPTSGFA